VPTLAELLQSDGETDLLDNQAYAGADIGRSNVTDGRSNVTDGRSNVTDGRSNVTDAVPSLGALLEEEDTDMSLVGAHNVQQRQPERTIPGATQLPCCNPAWWRREWILGTKLHRELGDPWPENPMTTLS
jgi:hypothetical protein